MENIIWFVIMIPCSAIFTGIGIYAWKRKKPMWFWSGSSVKESEIRDIKAYNRANDDIFHTSVDQYLCYVLECVDCRNFDCC